MKEMYGKHTIRPLPLSPCIVFALRTQVGRLNSIKNSWVINVKRSLLPKSKVVPFITAISARSFTFL